MGRTFVHRCTRAVVVAAVFLVPLVQTPIAKADTVVASLVRTLDASTWNPASPDPAGIAYLPGVDGMMIADSEVDETTGAGYHGVNVWLRTRTTDQHIRTFTTTSYTNEPTGLAYDAANNRLFISSDSGEKLFILSPGNDGLVGTGDDSRTTILLAGYGVADAEDVAYNTQNGHVYIADGTPVEVWDIDPVDGVLGNGNDTATHFDVAVHGGRDSEGLAYDPVRNTILVADRGTKRIYELTTSGGLVRTIDARGIAGLQNPADVEVAPASNGSGARNYWIADRTVDNGTNASENDGLVFEIAIPGAGTDTPPTVTLTAPAAGATVSGTAVALSANASDDNGVTMVEWFLDSGTTAIATDTDSAGGWTGTWNSTLATDGSHTITARATDTIGQTANHQRSVTVDNIDELPSVTLTAPGAGATVSGTAVALSANASDDEGVTKVEWFLDAGSTPIATDTSSAGGWTGSWDSTSTSNGSHTITARATDTIGQTANHQRSVTVDNVDAPPSVTLTAPGAGATVSGTAVALSANASDNNGVAQVEFFLDGTVSLGTDTDSAGGWTGSWDSTLATDGSHTITARATDTIGQTANHQRSVTVDNIDELPSVTLTAPGAGATVSGTAVALSANASDDEGVTKVEWFLDAGSTAIATDTSSAGGWTGSWDSTSASYGPHTITATATDTIGQTADDQHSIDVDNDAPPSVEFVAPTEGSTVAGAVDLEATASDDDGVAQVEYFLDGTVSLGTDTDSAGGWTGSWDSTLTTDGSHTITARATDTIGQTANDQRSVTVDNIDEIPSVTLTAPEEGALVRGSTVSLAAAATDDHGVAQVEFFLDETVSLGVDADGSDGWTGTWDSTLTSDGPHAISAVATDTIAQTASSAASVTVDNTPPTEVHITSPADGQSVVGTIAVMASATDAASVEFFRDAVSIGTDTNGADGWSVSWNTAGTSTGAHTLTATATDPAGNESTSPGVTVTVDNPLILEIPIASGTDDAEQKPNRNVVVNSADIDMMTDNNVTFTAVGLRFTGVNLPADATITNAYIQFTADEARDVPSNLRVRGEKALNPGTFVTAKSNITNRATTDATAAWSSPGWIVRFARTAEQRTPDLSAIVQEIIGQSGWTPGNAVVFIVTGNPSGRLVASSFEGGGGGIPGLHIEYTIP
ncbi:MAG: Ig-like domain-containing protein [Actinomycetota bacterium]